MTIVLPTSNAILATTLSAHFSLHKARVKVIQREIPEVHSHHNSVERLPTPQPLASHKRATPTWPSVPNQGRKKRLAKLEPTPRLTLSAPPATQPDTTSLEVEPPDGYHTQAAPAGKNFTPPEPGTSNLEKNLGHLALEEEAKQSISKEPNSLNSSKCLTVHSNVISMEIPAPHIRVLDNSIISAHPNWLHHNVEKPQCQSGFNHHRL